MTSDNNSVKCNFRKSSWGISQEEVKAIEGVEPIFEDVGVLVFKDNMFSKDCNVIYWFDNDKLSAGAYDFETTDREEFDLASEYYLLKDKLCTKYGNPSKPVLDDEELFQDDALKKLIKDEALKEQWPDEENSIANGDLKYFGVWRIEDKMDIRLILSSNDPIFAPNVKEGELVFRIMYISHMYGTRFYINLEDLEKLANSDTEDTDKL